MSRIYRLCDRMSSMKLQRFCIPEIILQDKDVGEVLEIKNDALVHQLKDVFRFEVEDVLNIFDGQDLELQCKIFELTKKLVRLEIVEILKSNETLTQSKNITLAFALLKGEHTEMVLEKCTELGVTNFQPLMTDRTVKTGFRRERLEKIITEAAEQSGWVKLPKLEQPLKLEEFLAQTSNKSISTEGDAHRIEGTNIFVMDIHGESFSDLNLNLEKDICILIGPEGGWSENERDLFKKLNLKTFSLGSQTLRAETASISSVSKML